jgi:hypothetical protein
VTSEAETIKDQFLWALAESLLNVDVDYLLTSHDSIQAIADRMIASLPTVFLDPVGPCHTTARLATWQGVSRQAIFRGHRTGRLFGLKHKGALVYPDIQFGPTGRPLPAVHELLATATAPLTDAVQVAAWLRTPGGESGSTPLEILEASRNSDAADRLRRPELYSPRMIDPRGLAALSPKRTARQ